MLYKRIIMLNKPHTF